LIQLDVENATSAGRRERAKGETKAFASLGDGGIVEAVYKPKVDGDTWSCLLDAESGVQFAAEHQISAPFSTL
jgi:hypothetical protein